MYVRISYSAVAFKLIHAAGSKFKHSEHFNDVGLCQMLKAYLLESARELRTFESEVVSILLYVTL